MKYEVPIYEKSNLTLEETAAYFNIGINKIREISDSDKCTFVLWAGNKLTIDIWLLLRYHIHRPTDCLLLMTSLKGDKSYAYYKGSRSQEE